MATSRTSNPKTEDKGVDTKSAPIAVSLEDLSYIKFTPPQGSGTIAPDPSKRIAVTIASNVICRHEGQSDTWPIWTKVINKDFLARQLTRDGVMNESAKLLSNNSLAKAIEDLVQSPVFRPDETLFTKPEIFKAVSALTNRVEVAHVLTEMLIGPLVKVGMVSETGRYAVQVNHKFGKVTTEQIAEEVALVTAFNALEKADIKFELDKRQSRSVFGAAVAAALRPVGLALLQTASLLTIVSDIVIGVRAYLTPAGTVGGAHIDVPTSWVSNPLVAEFAQCLPFVESALRLSSATPLRLENEGRDLDASIRQIMQILRDSPRYNMVSKTEALRHYGVMKIRNVRDVPVAVVSYRALAAKPVAQSVIAVEDIVLGDAARVITPTKDRVAEFVQLSYGKADLSTSHGARVVRSALESLVQVGFTGMNVAVSVDAGNDGVDIHDLATLVAEKTFVVMEDDVVVETQLGRIVWWYQTSTDERTLELTSGQHYITEVLTNDPVELLLAARSFEARDTMPERRQLLAPAAFGASVIGFDDKQLLSLRRRYSFAMKIGSEKVNGSFHTSDFASMRSSELTHLVSPHYNVHIMRALLDSYAAAYLIADKAKLEESVENWSYEHVDTEVLSDAVRRRCLMSLLQLAQSLSPTFRTEVHRMIIARALAASSHASETALMMRSQLVQQAFTALVDLEALKFFFYMHGVEISNLIAMCNADEMYSICASMGSDRSLESYVA